MYIVHSNVTATYLSRTTTREWTVLGAQNSSCGTPWSFSQVRMSQRLEITKYFAVSSVHGFEMEKKKLFLHCLSSSHCGSCQIKNTVIYLYISPHEISIISSWYPHSQCVFTSSGPFQHWEPRAVWVVEVVLRRISATWRAWVSSLGDDELKLGWFGMKGGGKKMENMDTWTWYYVQWWFISFLYPNGWLP
jgi:hypothetical protein